MAIERSLVRRLMALFAGYDRAYGTYDREVGNPAKGGKLEIKGTARTVRGEVTEDLWLEHLTGRNSLGIIPIKEDGTCKWGAIDIDSYDVVHAHLVEEIERRHLPLLLAQTKSGGAHLYMFTKNPIPASMMMSTLRNIAAAMGYGRSEIFPKQTHMLVESGDLGSWLNMPYFGEKRLGVKRTGSLMTLEEFVARAEAIQSDSPDLKGAETSGDNELTDGPPCLQHLSTVGFPEGTRNNGLFALGVFAKKKYEEKWREVLEEFNRKYMKPPLSGDEVRLVIKSLEKRDYNYRCNDQPCVSHCDSTTCRTRKFGVGDPDAWPNISGLSVLDTDPPIWFMGIDEERIEMTTDDLQNYRRFQKLCMEGLHIVFQPMKQETWLKMIGEAMKSVTIIDAPPEVSRTGRFTELLNDFLTNRQKGTKMDDILSGRPWEDQEREVHCFRLRDLMDFLGRETYKELTRAQVTVRLREMGGDRTTLKIKTRTVGVWTVPLAVAQPTPAVDPPSIAGAPF